MELSTGCVDTVSYKTRWNYQLAVWIPFPIKLDGIINWLCGYHLLYTKMEFHIKEKEVGELKEVRGEM